MTMYSTFLAVGAISVTGAYIWGRHFYQTLALEIEHTQVNNTQRMASTASGKLESLPTELTNAPDDFRILHEKDEKAIPNLTLPDNNETQRRLFTELLRRDMRCFTQMPQSWMMWLMLRKTKLGSTFSSSHITQLDFQEGDIFCGVYRVSRRRDMKVEIEMIPPDGFPPLKGLLVIAVDHGDAVVLRTETLQWINAKTEHVLPLERPLIRFIHHMASWWLLVSGARYFSQLIDREE